MSWRLFAVVVLLLKMIFEDLKSEIKSQVIKIKTCPRYLYIKENMEKNLFLFYLSLWNKTGKRVITQQFCFSQLRMVE